MLFLQPDSHGKTPPPNALWAFQFSVTVYLLRMWMSEHASWVNEEQGRQMWWLTSLVAYLGWQNSLCPCGIAGEGCHRWVGLCCGGRRQPWCAMHLLTLWWPAHGRTPEEASRSHAGPVLWEWMHEWMQPRQLLGPLWGFATVQLPRDLPGLQHLMRIAEFLGREITASSASAACKAPFSDFPSLVTQATSRIALPTLLCSSWAPSQTQQGHSFLKSGTVPKTQGYKSRERIRHFFWNFPRVREHFVLQGPADYEALPGMTSAPAALGHLERERSEVE